MLSNAYFLAKIRFDTAENEPAKNLQKKFKKFLKIANFANFANPNPLTRLEHRRIPRPSSRPRRTANRASPLRSGALLAPPRRRLRPPNQIPRIDA